MTGCEIDLVRHGETEANAAGMLQGWGDSPLSARGARQARAVAARLDKRDYALVASSHLTRAVATAAPLGEPVEIPDLAEMDMGAWEGMTWQQVVARHPVEMEALREGKDVTLDGGESTAEFSARIQRGLTQVRAMLSAGERALVVTHGGVIHTTVRRILGTGRGPLGGVTNGALTTLRWEGDDVSLAAYNDTWHVAADHEPRPVRGSEVWLVRHGETKANVGLRWQGRTDSPLTARGLRQARLLAERMPAPSVLYTSPAGRARATADAISQRHGIGAGPHPGLAEMDFGSWEDLTTAQAAAADPAGWSLVYERGVDAPRGGSGETFESAGRRLAAAVKEMASGGNGPVVGVTHGGVLRAFVAGTCGVPFSERLRVGLPDNLSVTRVGVGGCIHLVAYNTTLIR